jgi:HPt (histidine-containing phosphotransfer) domain-containing protein
MLDELRERFKQRFLDTARARIARTRTADGDMGSAASEMHGLAGEAALLEYVECARLARAAEAHARAGEGRKCKEAIDALATAVEGLTEPAIPARPAS